MRRRQRHVLDLPEHRRPIRPPCGSLSERIDRWSVTVQTVGDWIERTEVGRSIVVLQPRRKIRIVVFEGRNRDGRDGLDQCVLHRDREDRGRGQNVIDIGGELAWRARYTRGGFDGAEQIRRIIRWGVRASRVAVVHAWIAILISVASRGCPFSEPIQFLAHFRMQLTIRRLRTLPTFFSSSDPHKKL